MKKLALALLLAAACLSSQANAQSGTVAIIEPNRRVEVLDVTEPMRNMTRNEDAQDIERYVRPGDVAIVAQNGCGMASPCGMVSSCGCCPSECTRCIPHCCPDLRGIFDGGLPKGDCSRCHVMACKDSYWAGQGFKA